MPLCSHKLIGEKYGESATSPNRGAHACWGGDIAVLRRACTRSMHVGGMRHR